MRVVVFGAGYAGLTVARRLERHGPDDMELIVVDESETHLVQHELHRVVRRPSLAETLTVPLSEVLTEAEIRQARVTEIDAEQGVATLAPVDGSGDETTLEYDVGAVCLGAETDFYDLAGVEEHAKPLKRLADAPAIHDDAVAGAGGAAVVGGAGLSGVQVAGELAALSADEELDLDVTVVERSDDVASGFDPAFRTAVRQELDARDVTVETGVAVEEADDETVHLADGRSLPADVFVWTGGIHGPAAFGGDRPRVESDLWVSDNTVVVGDAGRVVGADGASAPASAQTAIRQARIAAKNVRQRVEETADASDETGTAVESRATYEYDSLGWVVSVGDGAVAQVGPVVLSGEPARAAKAVIGAGHLSSVGSLGNAADLVAEEFGWPTHDSVVSLTDLPTARLPTDPASPGELQSTLGATGFALADAFAPGEAVDLTLVTRLADRRFPGSPVNLLEQTLCAPLSLFERGDDTGSSHTGNEK